MPAERSLDVKGCGSRRSHFRRRASIFSALSSSQIRWRAVGSSHERTPLSSASYRMLALAKKRGFLIGEGFEFGGEVLDVAWVGRGVEDLLDDRQEVVQGADRRQRHEVRAA